MLGCSPGLCVLVTSELERGLGKILAELSILLVSFKRGTSSLCGCKRDSTFTGPQERAVRPRDSILLPCVLHRLRLAAAPDPAPAPRALRAETGCDGLTASGFLLLCCICRNVGKGRILSALDIMQAEGELGAACAGGRWYLRCWVLHASARIAPRVGTGASPRASFRLRGPCLAPALAPLQSCPETIPTPLLLKRARARWAGKPVRSKVNLKNLDEELFF